MEQRVKTYIALMTSALVWAAACGTEEEAEDPAVHACEQVAEAAAELTASASPDDTAPELAFDGEPVRVALPAGMAGYVRVVTDAPEELGILFFDRTEVLNGIVHEGASLPATSAGANAFCPDEIPEHFDVDFEEPGTYFLELGPTATDEVWMILSDAGGHGH